MFEYSPYIKENFDFLKKLSTTKSDRKKNKLLLNSTADQILALVEIIANILKFNFPLTNSQKRKLRYYADTYRAIARVKTEKGARKQLQKGSGVALSAILVPVIAAIAQTLFEKR